ncbi:MAG TPA: SRPBCC family protein [Acidimicrobiales bacterium]|nr:SRPBCC family protein [Acidimicrobiales bacterium]
MTTEQVRATTTIDATPAAVFAALADPATHAAIDGTGWVQASLDGDEHGGRTITAAGQVFRMAMHHPDHPDGVYETANRVEVFDPPAAIAWLTGTEDPETGELAFGGWWWRYDLAPAGSTQTTVTLTYDWSDVPARIRAYLSFPPFPPEHLDRSLRHLGDIVTG